MPILHGIHVNEPLEEARPILERLGAVIGLVATAADADADHFPLNQAVLVTNVRSAIGYAGDEGTLGKALLEISNQGSPLIVVVRVEEGATAQDTAVNVVGGTIGNQYTGLQALLAAEQQLSVRPRILGCPGLDDQDVAEALAIVAQKLHGFAYVTCHECDDVADAATYRDEFGQRELMAIWPDFTGGPGGTWAGKAVAIALGTRARIDEEIGWHKSLSNMPINGVTGMTRDVLFDLQDMSTDAGVLNDADVTTLVQMRGHRFWGNRTCSDEPLFAFEVAVRTSQAIRDAIADGLLWAIDKPLTKGLVRDIVETINARLRRWIAQGRIIGGKCWYDEDSNAPADLAAGRLVLDYDYTPCAPLEGLTLNQRITAKYYEGFGDGLPA